MTTSALHLLLPLLLVAARLHHAEAVGHREHLAADHTSQTLASAGGGQRRCDDVLLGQHALYDTRRATDGLEEARVRRNHEDLGLNRKRERVAGTDIKL